MTHIMRIDEYVNNPSIPLTDKQLNRVIKKYNLVYNEQTELYDCNGDIKVRSDLVSNGRLIVNFGNVSGYFDCTNCGLISLKGCPQKVGGSFGCSFNNLSSLKGAPQEVGGSFECIHNHLCTLEGAPQKVGGYFDCTDNFSLFSLQFAPKIALKIVSDIK